MAFIRSSFPTSSTCQDCRIGISNALMMPATAARAYTRGIVTMPSTVRIPSASASSSSRVWSTSRARRRFTRSAIIPPYNVKRRTGPAPAVVTRPTCSGEFERTRAIQLSATVCIQLPQREMN